MKTNTLYELYHIIPVPDENYPSLNACNNRELVCCIVMDDDEATNIHELDAFELRAIGQVPKESKIC